LIQWSGSLQRRHFLEIIWRAIEGGAQPFTIVSQAESIFFRKLRDPRFSIFLVLRPKAFGVTALTDLLRAAIRCDDARHSK
jgi:hypothetical protein